MVLNSEIFLFKCMLFTNYTTKYYTLDKLFNTFDFIDIDILSLLTNFRENIKKTKFFKMSSKLFFNITLSKKVHLLLFVQIKIEHEM